MSYFYFQMLTELAFCYNQRGGTYRNPNLSSSNSWLYVIATPSPLLFNVQQSLQTSREDLCSASVSHDEPGRVVEPLIHRLCDYCYYYYYYYVNLLLKSLVDGKPICKAGKLIITNNQRFLVLFLLSTLILSSISWLSLIVWFFAQNGSLTLFRFGP